VVHDDSVAKLLNKIVENDQLRGPHIFSMVAGDKWVSSVDSRKPYAVSNELTYEVKKIEDTVVDNPSFPEKDRVFDIVKRFRDSPREYERRGLTHNLAIMLHGFPGCGKTRCFTDLSVVHDLVVIVVATHLVLTPESLRTLFFSDYVGGYSVPHHRRLYVIEDVDCGAWGKVILDRCHYGSDRSSNDVFSLETYLQVMDGIVRRKGHIVFYTTNCDPEDSMDPAFLRPGRIDAIIRVNKMTARDIAAMYKRWFDQDLPDDIEKLLRDYKYSVADMTAVFRCFDSLHVQAELRTMFPDDGKIIVPNVSTSHLRRRRHFFRNFFKFLRLKV
jgi:hypothetical protein